MQARNKDESIFRMLQSERERCLLVAEKVVRELEKLPKGSIGTRKVKTGVKEYCYPCLRFRKGAQVLYEHLSGEKASELKPLLEKRKKLESDLKANKKRIATIDSIIHKG